MGAAGPAGPAGSTGATGPAGPLGSTEYGYIYSDIPQIVPTEDAVTFSDNGVLSAGIAHVPGEASIVLAVGGDYAVTYSVSVTGVNQVALFVDGVVVPGTTYGAGAGTQQNTGQVIITAAAGSILTLRNHTTAGAFALETPIGGTQPTVNASILIEKLA